MVTKSYGTIHIAMPNGTDNNERDVIATMDVTSWTIHYHTVSIFWRN